VSRLGRSRRRWFGGRLPNPELHCAFLRAAGNYSLNQRWVGVEVHLDQAPVILVWLAGDPLHFIRVRALNEDHEFAVILQPSCQEQLVER